MSPVLDRSPKTLSRDQLRLLDAIWRAANYLSVGQIYHLQANPLMKRPLRLSDVKSRLLGHWGTTPGLNFVNLPEIRNWKWTTDRRSMRPQCPR